MSNRRSFSYFPPVIPKSMCLPLKHTLILTGRRRWPGRCGRYCRMNAKRSQRWCGWRRRQRTRKMPNRYTVNTVRSGHTRRCVGRWDVVQLQRILLAQFLLFLFDFLNKYQVNVKELQPNTIAILTAFCLLLFFFSSSLLINSWILTRRFWFLVAFCSFCKRNSVRCAAFRSCSLAGALNFNDGLWPTVAAANWSAKPGANSAKKEWAASWSSVGRPTLQASFDRIESRRDSKKENIVK